MSWGDVISISLGLGNLAVNSANANTLQQMKTQQVGEALIREYIGLMRNGIFNLKQAAEDVLAIETESPLKAAGAMRILDYQLSTSKLTPDLFYELTDKEYAAATSRLISDNSRRMYAALDKNGQVQVDQVVEFIRWLPDCRYYLEHAEKVSEVREARVRNAQKHNKPLISLKKVVLAIVVLILITVLILSLPPPEALQLGLCIVTVAGVAALVGFIWFYFRLFIESPEARALTKAEKELASTVDLERFAMLEKELKTPNEAMQALQQAEQYIERFFEDATLLQDGWRA